MSRPVAQGTALPLRWRAGDGEESLPLYVQATIKSDDNGLEISGSPVLLTVDADAWYKNNTVPFPDATGVTVVYEAFYDAGLTLRSHQDAIDRFHRLEDVQGGGSSSSSVGSDPIIIQVEDDSLSMITDQEDALSVGVSTEEDVALQVDDGEDLSVGVESDGDALILEVDDGN